jgi:hypothetical protein
MADPVMTYASLVGDIKKYSERPNDEALDAQIPSLILLAENECATDLRVLGSELVAESSLVIGAASVEKPAYWRRTTSVTIDVPSAGRSTLEKRTYEFIRNFWPDPSQTGVPRYYAEYDFNNFIVAPTPDASYDFELVYFARLDPLSDANQTNWFTSNAPQLLLYSSMYHTSLYLKNFDKAREWKSHYDTALAGFRTEDASRSYDRGTVEG